MVKEKVLKVVEEIVKAYNFIVKELGITLPSSALEQVLNETSHIAIHELAHALIHTVYPEIEKLHDENPSLGECVDEVGGRIVETYISRKVGAFIHSFEEHVHELEHYTYLKGLRVTAKDLEELYEEVSKALERNRVKEVIGIIIEKCKELTST